MTSSTPISTPRDRSIPPGVLDPSRRTITNAVMKDSIHFHEYGYENSGHATIATLTCAPGGGPPMHYHNTYTERFKAIDGNLVLYLDGTSEEHKIVLKPGESAEVPIGHAHRFTCEEDGLPVDSEGKRKEVITFEGSVWPSHAGFERSLYIMYGLANDGLANSEGVPKNVVHLALIAEMSDMRFPGWNGAVVNWLGKGLAWWARWMGEEERLLEKYWD
jgi:quercetin dioxygenase-like cupin family protein